MCLAFMQSEHIKKLLFAIHPLFFNLMHRAEKGRGAREVAGLADWRPAVAGKGSASSAVAGFGFRLAG